MTQSSAPNMRIFSVTADAPILDKTRFFLLVLPFVIIGFLLSISQAFGLSPDFEQYNEFFDLVRADGFAVVELSRFEPGFSLVSIPLVDMFSSNVFVYSVFVFFTLMMKGTAINTMSQNSKIFAITAIFYVARYFPLHELTQLRASCAMAFALLGALIFWKGRRIVGVLVILSGVLFHFSSAALLPPIIALWGMDRVQNMNRSKALLIGSISFVLIGEISYLASDYLSNFLTVFKSYQENGFGDDKANPLSSMLLLDWALITVSFYMWEKLSPLMKQVITMQLIGMAIFYGAIDLPIIAHRLREFYSIFLVIFIADGLRIKEMKYICLIFAVASSILSTYLFFFHGDFSTFANPQL